MRSKRDSDGGDLNLVPIMNLVTILIPFLLMSTQFVSLSVLDVTQPAIGEHDEEIIEEPDERLGLKILITQDGYIVASDGQSIGDDDETTVDVGTDLGALNDLLADIKRDWPEESMVVLVPDTNTSYDKIIQVMDAARSAEAGDLFPNVIVAGGGN